MEGNLVGPPHVKTSKRIVALHEKIIARTPQYHSSRFLKGFFKQLKIFFSPFFFF
jgi:hypothetical protein